MRRLLALLLCTACGGGSSSSTDGGPKPDGGPRVDGGAGDKLLVGGANLTLQDSSPDGQWLAYTDATRALFTVKTDGTGTPIMVATGIDRARYDGGFLLALTGIDPTGKTASSMQVYDEGSGTRRYAASAVKLKTVRASHDGKHLAWAQATAPGSSQEDILLDGNPLVTGINSERPRFSLGDEALVSYVKSTDPTSGATTTSIVAWAPLATPTPTTLVAQNAAKRFEFAPGVVIVGANTTTSTTDLTKMSLTGTGATVVKGGADNGIFGIVADGKTLIYAQGGALRAIGLDGSGDHALGPSGVVDLPTTSTTQIVYATTQDPTTLVETLGMVDVAGTRTLALGSLALDEGFTSDGAFYTFRDGLVGTSGRLQRVDVAAGALKPLASSVVKTSLVDDTRVVYVTSGGDLILAMLSDGSTLRTLAAGATGLEALRDGVGVATASRVAYAVGSGTNAGIWVTSI